MSRELIIAIHIHHLPRNRSRYRKTDCAATIGLMLNANNSSSLAAGRDEVSCLEGNQLWGDDFSEQEIRQWFADEENAYFALGCGACMQSDADAMPEHGYSALNERHAFRYIRGVHFGDVLALGAADGRELVTLMTQISRLTILEPAKGFWRDTIAGKPVTYRVPAINGKMEFADRSFDLVIAFSVLHHIPNVSAVVSEMARVLRPGGIALLREPTVSMSDWRRPRPGLTPHERGIPLKLFRNIVSSGGFDILHEKRCCFPVFRKMGSALKRNVWSSPLLVAADDVICRLPIWPRRYHAVRWFHKLQPADVAYVLRRAG